MAYTVKELAKLSGVSVRTLHFYDEINLLKPAYHGENGYRYYEKDQLLLLQQILFFRELDLPLTDIHRILCSSDFDKLEALKSHKRILKSKATRMNDLIETIDKTIASLEGGKKMKEKEMYKGFIKAKQEKYEQYWIENGGKDAKRLVAESKGNTKTWKDDDYEKVSLEFDALDKKLTLAIEKNLQANAADVQAVVREHFNLISRFYKPTIESYVGLGKMYLEHPDFRKRYDSFHPKLAAFWGEAMKKFAEQELA